MNQLIVMTPVKLMKLKWLVKVLLAGDAGAAEQERTAKEVKSETNEKQGLSADGLPQKSTGGDDSSPVKAISSAPNPPKVDQSAVVPPISEVPVSEVDINKMKPTTTAVLSDKIGDHPDISVSDLDASKKVIPSTKALVLASAEGVVLSHDKSSEMKPASLPRFVFAP